MRFRPPRILAATMALAGVLFAGITAYLVVATFTRPLLLPLAVLSAGAAVSGFALAVIQSRTVDVGNGELRVGGIGGRVFPLEALTPPLELGLFGLRLGDARHRLRVLGQLPRMNAVLLAELPTHAPQLRTEPRFPVVVPGRISAPLTYGVIAAIGVVMGSVGMWVGFTGDEPSILTSVFALAFFVFGAVALWWVLFRVERRVEIHADRIVRRRLLMTKTEPVAGISAAHVVTESRSLPRSTLEREVHLLRLVEPSGRVHDVAPGLASFPDYGSEGEGRLAEDRAAVIGRLAGVPPSSARLHRAGPHELALWHHGESSPGANRSTYVFRAPVSGRHVIGALDGRVSINALRGRFALGHAHDHLLVVVPAEAGLAVHRVRVDGRIDRIDAGFGRLFVVANGERRAVDMKAAIASAAPGWPAGDPPMPGVPAVPWLAATEEVARLVAADGTDELWQLLASRSFPALIRRWPDVATTAVVLDVWRMLDRGGPSGAATGSDVCFGSGRPTELGPDGRPECSCCGTPVSIAPGGEPVPAHGWPVSDCAGGLWSPAIRDNSLLRGICRRCRTEGPLTGIGLVRTH